LEQLLTAVPLERIVFVVDPGEGEQFLTRTLAALWSGVPADSPNRRVAEPTARLFVAASRRGDVRALLATLFATPAYPAAAIAGQR
jgi:hypothetical protein